MNPLLSKLNNAFQQLRSEGYFAAQDWACCQTCGFGEIDKLAVDPDHCVFYHAQDTARLEETGRTLLAWRGDGKQICQILNRSGIKTEWNGSEDQRIQIDANEVTA